MKKSTSTKQPATSTKQPATSTRQPATSTKQPATSTKQPKLKWQTENYALTQDFRFRLPYSFLLLCKLWNTTPNEILSDFMDNLSCGSWKREGRDEAKQHLVQYILAMHYAKDHYTKEDIRQQFTQLEAIGLLWPANAKMKMIEQHARWRDNYYNWWFKKWYKKYHRKPITNNK